MPDAPSSSFHIALSGMANSKQSFSWALKAFAIQNPSVSSRVLYAEGRGKGSNTHNFHLVPFFGAPFLLPYQYC